MERIFDANQPINSNQYLYLTIKTNRNRQATFVALAYSQEDERYYIFSNRRYYDGRKPSSDLFDQLPLRFAYSWQSSIAQEGLTLNKVFNEFRDLELYGLEILDDEVEVTTPSINAESFIHKNYSEDNLYTGQSGYHSHLYSELNTPVKSFRGHRIGVELEVEFEDEDLRENFNSIPSNWFYRESDGSLGDWGCEIITIPLLPKDAKSVEFWSSLTEAIEGVANSWDNGRCGLHVHIGREILGKTEDEQQSTLGKLLLVYHEFIKDSPFNRKVYGRERGYNDHDGKTTLSSAVKELGVRILSDGEVAKKVQKSLLDRSEYDRYFDINTTRSATIEFRRGRGSINPHRIAMVVEYSEMLCMYAKQAVWQQLSYENFIHYLKANCKKGTSLYDLVMNYA